MGIQERPLFKTAPSHPTKPSGELTSQQEEPKPGRRMPRDIWSCCARRGGRGQLRTDDLRATLQTCGSCPRASSPAVKARGLRVIASSLRPRAPPAGLKDVGGMYASRGEPAATPKEKTQVCRFVQIYITMIPHLPLETSVQPPTSRHWPPTDRLYGSARQTHSQSTCSQGGLALLHALLEIGVTMLRPGEWTCKERMCP